MSGRFYASRRLTRTESIDIANYSARQEIQHLDRSFDLLNRSVTRLVDLGSGGGNWLDYARMKLLNVHKVDADDLYKKCTLIGFDLLAVKPPRGVYYTQGNIFSQSSHQTIIKLLQESSLKIKRGQLSEKDGSELSYLEKEKRGSKLETELDSINNAMLNLSIKEGSNESHLPDTYQADVILSDFSFPQLQDSGFFNNTQSKPYIRSSSNKVFRLTLSHPEKASLDLADAALILCCEALKKGGKLALRLNQIDLADPELNLLESRLLKVFTRVMRWAPDGSIESHKSKTLNMFLVCDDKMDHLADKYEVFK